MKSHSASFLPLCFLAFTASCLAGGVQGIGLIQDSFSYTGWNTGGSPMNAVWAPVNGNTPAIVTNNPSLAPTYVSLNNGVIGADLGRTLVNDFQVSIDILHTQFQRGQWVGLFNAAGTEGYAFVWDSGVAANYLSEGAVSIRKYSVSGPSVLAFNAYGTPLGAAAASGHDPGNTANAALSAPFAHFLFTWSEATRQLQVSVDGAVVTTVTDAAFSSFSKIYVGGGNTGLFANLSVAVPAGASVPFATLEAEDPVNATNGTVVKCVGAPSSSTDTPELEASGRSYVALATTGQHLDFPNVPASNALVIRHSIPDATMGGGATATLSLYVNGTKRQTLTLGSRHNWLYGAVGSNGQSNSPSAGAPHVFWDESRFLIVGGLHKGDTLRLEKDGTDIAAFYHIDMIDLEEAPAPLGSPAAGTYLSVADYGATGNGVTDDTAALAGCIAAAKSQHKVAWIPSGTYNQSASLALNGVVVRGAGMWYTTLVGTNANATVGNDGFTLGGSGSEIHDLSLDNSSETTRIAGGGPIQGNPSNFVVDHVWITHTQTGFWLSGASYGSITNCRVRGAYSDGIHLDGACVENLVENNHVRGCGDDGIAVLARTTAAATSSGNSVRFNTVASSWWGMDLDVAGGDDELVEYNYLADGVGSACCGVMMASAYPVYPFTDSTIDRNVVVRGGGNFGGVQQPAFWIHPMCAIIDGLLVQDNYVADSYFSGMGTTGSYRQNVTFDGNIVANSGANGFQINNSSGAGTFTGNVVDGVGAYQPGSAPFFNGGGGGYTVTASDNSWQ